MRIKEKLLSIFFPKKCSFCRRVIDYTNLNFICEDCEHTLPYIQGTVCTRCNRPISPTALSECFSCRKYKHSFSKSYTPLLYKDKARLSILSMKFYSKESYAKSYAYLIASSIISSGFPSFDFITYVPLAPSELKRRGYNQCETIAENLGEYFKLPVIATLKRIDGTPKQSRLSHT